jgi:uncharacterized repeat protein (TIGR01451 family)
MRRPLLLLTVTVCVLGSLFLFLTFLAESTAAASAPQAPANQDLRLEVNYAHDWVAGAAISGTTVAVTVTDSGGAVKNTASVTSDPAGEYFVNCEDWDAPECPDVVSGDRVTVTAGSLVAAVNPVGQITGELDEVENTVSGVVNAPWFSGTLTVTCMIWVDVEVTPVETSAGANGGGYLCNFDDVGWDLAPGDSVAVMYSEPDGDGVINVFRFPWARVNYAHDWVGADYEAGHTFWITVSDDVESVKATAQIDSEYLGGWEGDGFETQPEDWSPEQPDIVPGDSVEFQSDDGYGNLVKVGTIDGDLDVDADAISGTLKLPGSPQTLDIECHPQGAWEYGEEAGVKTSTAGSKGSPPYACSWAGEWDIVPGRDVAVMYLEEDIDRVINVFRGGVPHLQINKYAEGEAGEGGNLMFRVEYWNDGDGPAENVIITDTMEGMSYLYDTSPFSVSSGAAPGGEYVAFDLGVVDAQSHGDFSLYVAVGGAVSDTITNTVEITTTNPYEEGEPAEKISQWLGHIVEGDTHLNIGKHAWTEDPLPGSTMIFAVNVCNDGATGSSYVTLTDTLHPALSVEAWWSEQPGWQELSTSDSQIILANPSIPGGWCNEVNFEVKVSETLTAGDYISNTAVITAANDLEGDGNEAFWEGQIGEPRVDLSLEKWWRAGSLVPGGTIIYKVHAHNEGNLPVEGPITISDVLPAETSFVASWQTDEMGQHPFAPVLTTAGTVLWEIPTLDNGYGFEFEVELQIDGGAAPGTALTNTAEISPQPEEERYDNNIAVWVEALQEPGPNLRIRKEGGWSDWGEETRQAWYHLSIENTGDEWIGPVSISDTYPGGMLLDGGPDAEWERLEGWGDDPGSNVLTATFAYLEPGETTWFDFAAIIPGEGRAPSGLIFTNTAEVRPVAAETNPDDNLDEVVLTTGPDLFVEKELAGGQLRPGGLVTFSLRYGNDRPEHQWWWDLQGDGLLTDTLPAELDYVSAQIFDCGDQGPWCDFDPLQIEGRDLLWIVTPTVGTSNELRLTARISEGVDGDAILTNRVEIGSSEPISDSEAYTDNNLDSVVLAFALPHFEVSKVYASSRVAGTEVVYTVTVANVGAVTGTNVVAADTLPAGLSYLSSDGAFNGSAITWSFDEIGPSESAAGWFRATTPCTATFSVINDDYGVLSSDQGVAGAAGAAVSFDVVSPTIQAGLDYPAGPIVVGSVVHFTGTASTDGPALSYSWDFGDGGTATGLTATHTYLSDGDFPVTFTATDACGYSQNASDQITIDSPALAAGFEQSAAAIFVDETVYFTDTSTTDGPPSVSWSWDFGDGGGSALQNPAHTFTVTGVYTVTLTVTDSLGYSDQASGTVVVRKYALYLPLVMKLP